MRQYLVSFFIIDKMILMCNLTFEYMYFRIFWMAIFVKYIDM